MEQNTTYEAFELTREFLENLRANIEAENKENIIASLADLHAADIAEIYEELNIDEAKYTFLL